MLIEGGLAPISIEAKSYSALQLRTEWVDQARRNAGDRPWVIAQRPKGSRTIFATVDLNWLVYLIEHQTEGTPLVVITDSSGPDSETDRSLGEGSS